MKLTRMLLLTVAAVVICGAPAMAFHDGGVADCQGCHTMHNSQDNAAEATGTGTAVGESGNPELLLYPNPTDTCLRCHRGGASRTAGYAAWSAPGDATYAAFSQAGDFAFLEEDNLNDGHGGSTPANFKDGSYGGHNLRSGLAGTSWDTVLLYAPGSNPQIDNELECTSCHDPHGNSGFRMLYMRNQIVNVGNSLVQFGANLQAHGTSAGADPRNFVVGDDKNAYVGGYSGWCSTCHGNFHQASGSDLHPSGQALDPRQAEAYNAYLGTTDCVNTAPGSQTIPLSVCGSGVGTDVYLWQVPFTDPDFTSADLSNWDGPTSNSAVACVSCHFAHASSAMDSGRWDFQVSLLDEDGDESGSYVLPNPYDNSQRSLCNKCHSQDEYDELNP